MELLCSVTGRKRLSKGALDQEMSITGKIFLFTEG